jgi:hypothetical protein
MTRKLQDEYETWGLTLNLTKTKYLSTGKPEHNLSLEARDIKHCDDYKDLGMKINEDGRQFSNSLGRYAISTKNGSILWNKRVAGKAE